MTNHSNPSDMTPFEKQFDVKQDPSNNSKKAHESKRRPSKVRQGAAASLAAFAALAGAYQTGRASGLSESNDRATSVSKPNASSPQTTKAEATTTTISPEQKPVTAETFNEQTDKIAVDTVNRILAAVGPNEIEETRETGYPGMKISDLTPEAAARFNSDTVFVGDSSVDASSGTVGRLYSFYGTGGNSTTISVYSRPGVDGQLDVAHPTTIFIENSEPQLDGITAFREVQLSTTFADGGASMSSKSGMRGEAGSTYTEAHKYAGNNGEVREYTTRVVDGASVETPYDDTAMTAGEFTQFSFDAAAWVDSSLKSFSL